MLNCKDMKVVVEIPESAQVALPPEDSLARDLLEAYAIVRYRQGSLPRSRSAPYWVWTTGPPRRCLSRPKPFLR